MPKTMKNRALAAAAVTAAIALPATALVPSPQEVRSVAEMPLAVTEVVELGVPEPQVERVVVRLNDADVPVRDSVEIVRYSAFPLVVDTYRPPETAVVDLPWDLGKLNMALLVDSHFDDGLRGDSLAEAVLGDLVQLGFLAAADGWRDAPRPVDRDFIYYVEPGYRFDTGRGLFADRAVVIDREFIVDRGDWYRERDYDVARVVDYDDSDRSGPPAVPPGHAKHDRPDGPPGHTMHDGPDGPPGHAKHDDGRRSWRRGGRDRVDDSPGNSAHAGGGRDKGQGPGDSRGAAEGRGSGNGPGQDKGKSKGKGNGKGRGNGQVPGVR